jgi:signal transduction histidine kinase
MDIRPATIETGEPVFLQETVQQAKRLLRASGSAFYICGPASGSFRLAATDRFVQTARDVELLKHVCETCSSVHQSHPGIGNLLAVPSVWRDSVRGVLIVTDSSSERTFSKRDEALLQPLADLTAATLYQANRLERMTAQFRALHVIDIALTSSLQLDRVLNLILENAVGLVGAEHGSLRLLNPDTGELVLKAFLGKGWTPEVRAYTFPIGHGITGWVAEHQEPYLCRDAHRDPKNVKLFEEMQSGVAVPLLFSTAEQTEKELLGVLLLESTQPAAFDQHDVELLQAMAQEAVIAIQNATQQQKLQLVNQALLDEQERRVAAERWEVMGQAATALAHRINNLIGVVPASAGEIRRTLNGLELPQADRQWIDDNLDRIERNGRFVLRLADALFRPFKEPGPRARFDVNRLLKEALQAASLPSSIQVIQDHGSRLPEVESNSLLVDIFLELITNARKAMVDTPEKSLETRTRTESDAIGSWVVIEISDTGRGITAEQMPHLWDMFQTTTAGLGFGLWWVRTFIERQGGTISCESTPGSGTTFTVRLPAYDVQEPLMV